MKNLITILFLAFAGGLFAQPVRTTITDDGVNVTVQTPVNIKVIPICDFHWVFVDGQLKLWIEGGNELIPGGRLGNFTINGATTQQAKLAALGVISNQCAVGGGVDSTIVRGDSVFIYHGSDEIFTGMSSGEAIDWDFHLTVDTMTTSPGYANMDGAESFYTFSGDTLIQIGGWKGPGQSHNEQWYSLDDGATWAQADTAEWGGQHTFGLIKKEPYFYKIGADVFLPTHGDDVYKSSDGLNWTLVTSTAEFGDRHLFGTALRNDTMFVFGGQDTICNTAVYDDVWYSVNNGANWTQLCDNCVPENGGHIWRNIAEYDNYFWLVAGEVYDDCIGRVKHKKVYKSADGINWTFLGSLPINTLADPGLSYSRTFVWNGFLWFYSGVYSSGPAVQSRYLLYTRDGVTWQNKTLNQLPATHAAALAVKDENTFVITSGGGSPMFNDVFKVSADRILVRKLLGEEVSRDTLKDELDGIYDGSGTVPSNTVATLEDSLSIGILKIKPTQVTVGDDLTDVFREALLVGGSIVLNQSKNIPVIYLNKDRDVLLYNDAEGIRLGFGAATNTTNGWVFSRSGGASNKIYLGDTGSKGMIGGIHKLFLHGGMIKSQFVTHMPGITINQNFVGIRDSTPVTTANVTIGAGTTAVASMNIKSGSLLASPLANHLEWDGSNLFITNSSVARKQIAYTSDIVTTLADYTTDISNTSTTETDLYSTTTPANTLGATGDKLIAKYYGLFNDATANCELSIEFGASTLYSTGALALTGTGQWGVDVLLIRTGATTARSVVTIYTDAAAVMTYVKQSDLTGLDFTTTNVMKITGTATGGGGGTGDITAKLGTLEKKSAAL